MYNCYFCRYLFRSGNVEHPSDRLYNTTVEVLPVLKLSDIEDVDNGNYKATDDDFVVVGELYISDE